MDNNKVGSLIMKKRKENGLTQQNLANKLNVSFQAVSKWENGSSYPDIELLPYLAAILNTTVDSILGYPTLHLSEYEEKYKEKEFYWGLIPSNRCYDIMKIKPPIKPLSLIDIGCGEGKDAVFLAKNGYNVSAYDISETGINKARDLAKENHININFYNANILDYRLSESYDIIYSNGVFDYLPLHLRENFMNNLKERTNENGIVVLSAFVKKPFIEVAPTRENKENARKAWKSGELFTYFTDWYFHKCEEVIFDCNSGGTPHKHCMDILIAEKIIKV